MAGIKLGWPRFEICYGFFPPTARAPGIAEETDVRDSHNTAKIFSSLNITQKNKTKEQQNKSWLQLGSWKANDDDETNANATRSELSYITGCFTLLTAPLDAVRLDRARRGSATRRGLTD